MGAAENAVSHMAAVEGSMLFVAVAANSMDEGAENPMPPVVNDQNVPGVERIHWTSWHRGVDEVEEEAAINALDCEKADVVLDLGWLALRRI